MAPPTRAKFAPTLRVRPHGIDLAPLAGASNLSDALYDGVINSLISYKPPPSFLNGASNINRLFVDAATTEADYARRTGIFPIMHLLGVRREIAAHDPGLCLRVCQAFEEARQYAVVRIDEAQAPFTSLLWASEEAARSGRVLVNDFWSYGVGSNRRALEALCRYSHSQGIATRPMTVDELFVPITLEWVLS